MSQINVLIFDDRGTDSGIFDKTLKESECDYVITYSPRDDLESNIDEHVKQSNTNNFVPHYQKPNKRGKFKRSKR